MLELRGADGTDEVAGVDLRVADRTAVVAGDDALFDRLDLELPLPHVLEVLRRAEEHVDERPDERDDERDEGRQTDEERVLHPPARVLVRPVAE